MPEGRERSVVLQLVFAARYRVRNFELDLRPDDSRTPRPARCRLHRQARNALINEGMRANAIQ